MGYWIKLYTEILDDLKVSRLPNESQLLMYKLFLLAGKIDKQGVLPDSTKDIAFLLRHNQAWIEKNIKPLINAGIVTNSTGYVITNFAERQAPVTDAERSKQHRVTKNVTNASRNRHETVTNRDVDTDTDTEKKRIDTDGREAKSADADAHPNALIQAFKNITGRYPPKNTWLILTEKLTPHCDLEYLDEPYLGLIYDAWIAHGHNKTNYAGMLDWYISKSFSKQEAQRSHLTEVER
jgi:hypothetical protein